MKLQTLLLATHAGVAASTAILFIIAAQIDTTIASGCAWTLSLVALSAAVWFTSNRILAGLASLESAVADHESSDRFLTGLKEFDQSASRIGQSAARWEGVASNARHQAKEFQTMMRMLNRRDTNGEPSSGQLRELLAGLGNTLYSQLKQIERGSTDIEQCTRKIAEGADQQRHMVIKTTAYVEQLSTTIDTVASSAQATKGAMEQSNAIASDAQELVSELVDGLGRIRAQSQTCEKKLNGLSDPSRQISSIVATISDIAARTDLLALNASIESIRAGEHGRGFAVVAEEVRALAEQASDATREITSLVDSMQLVTDESIRGIERERELLHEEIERAVNAQGAITEICGLSDGNADQARQIAQSSRQQLQLAQDIVVAIEQISEIAKSHGGSAETANWTMKALADSTPQFSTAVQRLRSCGGMSDLQPEEDTAPLDAAAVVPSSMPMMAANPVSVG